jgi:hypothetical protein
MLTNDTITEVWKIYITNVIMLKVQSQENLPRKLVIVIAKIS